MTKQTISEWTDARGMKYGPGDIVCIATVSRRSPQMVIGEVISINTTNDKGEPFFTRWNGPAAAQPKGSIVSNAKPTVTVTVQPLIDARGFYRTKNDDGKVSKSTYKIADNIVLVEKKA